MLCLHLLKSIMSQLKHKVSFQTGNYLGSPLCTRERVARMTRVTIDLYKSNWSYHENIRERNKIASNGIP